MTEKAIELQKRALQLRISGLTAPAIAERLGVTVPTAWRYYQAALDQLQEETAQDAAKCRTLELNRLDAVIAGHFDAATQEGDVHAAAVVIRAIEARSKLLGLYLQLDSSDRMIAVQDLQRLLADRLRQSLERASAAGITIDLPSSNGSNGSAGGNGRGEE